MLLGISFLLLLVSDMLLVGYLEVSLLANKAVLTMRLAGWTLTLYLLYLLLVSEKHQTIYIAERICPP
jgi:hypothetical protein